MHESSTGLVFPHTKFEHVKKVLFALSERRRLKRVELAREIGLGNSILSNTVPILKKLNLIGSGSVKKRDLLTLTFFGRELVRYIKNNDKEKMLKFAMENLLGKSKVLDKAHKILRSRDLTSAELGYELAKEFGKKWDCVETHQSVGRSCKELLGGFGLIKYQIPAYKGYGRQKRNELVPTASSNKIFSILRELKFDEPTFIVGSLKKEKQIQKRLSEFHTLIDLGLVKQVKEKYFELSEIGEKLKSATTPEAETRIFRKILINHEPTFEVICKLKNKTFGWEDVGKMIGEYNGKHWSRYTIRGCGIKFLTWLKKADIVVGNDEYGKYKLNPSISFTDFSMKAREPQMEISEISPQWTLESSNGVLSKINEFNQYFADIIAEPNWYQNSHLKEKMIKSLNELKELDNNGLCDILVNPLNVLIKLAYENKDIKIMREVAKTGIKLREKLKHIRGVNSV